MRQFLYAAVAALLALGAGLVVPAVPAHAALNCNVPDPPPKCEDPPEPIDPSGALTGATRVPAGVRVVGWATHPDRRPVTISVLVVGAFVGTVTTGTSGGFTGTVPARAGDRVCAVAHNTGPTDVHLYDSGVYVGAFTANGNRPDLPAEYGAAHGYDLTLPANMATGDHLFCAYAINRSYGSTNTLLGCRPYNVPAPVVAPTILAFQDWDLTSKAVDLEWTDNSGSETGYRVDRSVAGGAWQEVWRGHPNAWTWTDQAVTPNMRTATGSWRSTTSARRRPRSACRRSLPSCPARPA